MKDQRFTNVDGAAMYYGKCKKTIYRYIRSGLIPYSRLPNGSIVIAFDDLDALVANFRRDSSKG